MNHRNPKQRRERCQDFIDCLNEHSKHSFRMDDPGTWIHGAMNVSGGQSHDSGEKLKINEQACAYLKSCIMAAISRLALKATVSQAYFDSVFFDLSHDVERAVHQHGPESGFTFGHAQKIITIYLKTLYAIFWSEHRVTCENDETIAWLGRWSGCLHIPVDDQSLKYFDENHLNRPFTRIGGKILSWKKHLGKIQYNGLQEQARNLAADGGFLDPLHFEMTKIWPQPEPLPQVAVESSFPAGQEDEHQVVFLDEDKNARTPYIKLKSKPDSMRNDGLIGKSNYCINLKLNNPPNRYLIGLIQAAGGNFIAMPEFARSRNGESFGHGGTGFEGHVPFASLEQAVGYLKRYFTVKACPWNPSITQGWIDAC